MSHPRSTRREFLTRAGAAGVTCLLPALAGPARPDAPKSARVRKNVADFIKDEKMLASLRAGVQKMRDLVADDPFSWVFQANIHGRPLYPPYVYVQADKSDDPAARLFRDKPGFTPDPKSPFSFSQCPHGNWWFLPWHRAYLYYFERILRWAAGNPDLALPYWNYSDAGQRELPPAFREPKANGKPNPLYLPESVTFQDDEGKPQVFPMRDGPLNQGLTQLTTSVGSLDALNVVAFTNSAPAAPGQAFGSPRACDTTCVCGSGALESTPHNKVHLAIGGSTATVGGGFRVGFMGDVPTAARDPIFWLHHCHIDRLWESWLAAGGGRANPNESEWLDYVFTFYDVGDDKKPKLVRVATRDLLNTRDLGYEYDRLEKPAELLAARPAAIPVTGQATRALATTPAPKREAGQPSDHPHPDAPRGGIQLKNTGSQPVPIPLVGGVTPDQFRIALAKPEEKGELLLAVEGIEFEQPPGVFYDLYLNLPGGEKATPEGPRYLGSLTFFGWGHHGGGHGHGAGMVPRTVRLTVPPEVRKLIEDRKLDPKELMVTFVPQTGTEPVVKGTEVKAPAEKTAVTVQRLRLLLVR